MEDQLAKLSPEFWEFGIGLTLVLGGAVRAPGSARPVRPHGAPMTAPVLETRRLWKSFGALPVTRDIDFALAPGARHALIGPNGAGKTSLINLITGVLRPDAAAQSRLAGRGHHRTVRPGRTG